MAKANVVEHGQSSKMNKNKFRKGPKMEPKGGVSKNKFLGKCYNCDRVGHRSSECRLPKMNNKKEANMVDDIANDVSEISLVVVISEVNLVGSNPREWWIDTVLPVMFVQIKRCSILLKQLRMERSCLWKIQLHLKSKAKVKWF
ncbi:CCHC-type domain-containing protein [Abeliophyllum distichum]|uniref:CCHC-type domain-containing protein n=1 Tax=Abeliophyllum distichum TaxID=126358 RepID=A0ABD1PDS0_9LAMI